MGITIRQQSILDAVIRVYIETARPVASRELMRRMRLAVSPATIRNDMQELGEAGYLEQPHASAGRMPTDKGYRFFVDYISGDAFLTSRERESLSRAFTASAEDFLREFTRVVARMCGAFAAARIAAGQKFYETGFSEVFDEPEFQDMEYTKRFGKLIDMMGDVNFLEAFDAEEERVYIGRENPVREAHPYTMIVSHWRHPAGFGGSLMLAGPKRMDYRTATALLQYLNSI